jgi:hypothetical protein
MKVANVTITGFIGPGNEVTALLLSNCSKVSFDFGRNIIAVTKQDGSIADFDYDDTATVTFTISGDTATITISN